VRLEGSPTGSASRRRRSARIEDLVGLRSAEVRRRLVIGLVVAVLVLAAGATLVAWKLYDDAKTRALTDLHARTVAVGAVLDASFAGDVSTLTAVSKSPDVVGERDGQIKSYLARAFPKGGPFTGGVGWIGLDGHVHASTTPAVRPTLDLSSRIYVRRAIATRKPYLSGGLIGLRNRHEILVIAVPTFDSRGRLSGVLAGSIVLKLKPEGKKAVDLGFGNLEVVDRNGRMLLTGLGHVTNGSLLATMRKTGSGTLAGVSGLGGRSDHVVAFATVKLPHWLIAIDRPSGSVFAAARHALWLELGSIGAALLIVFGLGFLMLRRTGRHGAEQGAKLESWSRLTRRLAAATTPAEVAEVLLTTLADAFPESVAVVAVGSGEGLRSRGRSRTIRLAGPTIDAAVYDAVGRRASQGPKTWLLAEDPLLARLEEAGRPRLEALNGIPMRGSRNELLGTLAIVTPARPFEPADWTLLESFADLGANALQRAWRFAREHDLALQLQRSLLPGGLPEVDGLELGAHYLAGAAAVEVGGDWYDAVRRPDGLIQLCVGDVSGRGIGAATVMNTQRSTFRAYAYECESPAAIVQRMLRHIENESEMITVAVVSIDPFTSELRYARAGHPAPLLLDRASGEIVRLEGAGAPPLGVAEPGDIVEEQLSLPDRAVLAMYTDGLIERRGLNMDAAIGVFAEVLAEAPEAGAGELVTNVGDRLGQPDDDVALLVVGFDAGLTHFDVELEADPSVLAGMRRRLRGWLSRREFSDDAVSEILLAVSEACNNAVEHAYPGSNGSLRVTAEVTGGWLEAVVEDRGRWREDRPAGDRGRGLLLIRRLMDSTEFRTDHRGTRAVLRRRAPAARVPGGERVSAPTRS
jgi:anti-sigma regulatory factor (Ser/Thr protein kinase)